MKEMMLRGTPGLWRMFGHTKGKAELISIELCRFYNGDTYENQRITKRNKEFSVALKTMRGDKSLELMFPAEVSRQREIAVERRRQKQALCFFPRV